MGFSLRDLGKNLWELITPQDEDAQRQAEANLRRANQRVAQARGFRYGALARPQARQQFARQNQAPDSFDLGRNALSSFADSLTKPSSWQQAPHANVGDFFGSGYIEDLINSPFKVGQGLTEIGQGDIKQGIGDTVTGLIEGPAGFIPITKAAQLAKGAGVLPKVVSGAKVGFKEGAPFGAAYGGSEALRQDANAKDTIKATLAGGALGGAGGAVLGGGAPVAVAGAKLGVKGLKKASVKLADNTTPLIANEAGSIASPKPTKVKIKNKEVEVIPKNTFTPPGETTGGIVLPQTGKSKVSLGGNTIDPTDPFKNKGYFSRVRNEFGRAFIDEDAEMIRMLRRLEKDTNQKGLVDQWLFNTNAQRASNSIANRRIEGDANWQAALKGLSKRGAKEFDEYIGARAELKNYAGKKTSRQAPELRKIVKSLENEYEPRFQQLNTYYKGLARDAYNGGLIDKPTLKRYLAADDYARIQRNMEDLVGRQFPSSRTRSIGTTKLKQKRTGSRREILSPTKSAIKRTQELQMEIQKNQSATEAIDVFSRAGLAKKVSPKQARNKNTIKRIVNGRPETWEVPRDIKRVVESVSPYQMTAIMHILSAPSRLLRAGTTALSAPFTVTNYLRDQVQSAIYSQRVLATHSPNNIAKGLYRATKDTLGDATDDTLWRKFIAYGGDQTIYDELRNAKSANRLLRETRKGGKGKAYNMVTNPIRSLEDLNSITERATRFQNFKGIYQKVLKDTGDENQATRAAVQAAYQNSVNFQRKGSWGRVLNLFYPYFNASIQGSRNIARSLRDRPVRTMVKSAGLVAAPTMTITAYNLADPDRRKIYDTISDFEKENNFVIIPPWVSPEDQKEDGTWEGVLKIPKPQGYRELTDPSREITEAFLGDKDNKVAFEIAKDMMAGFTGPIAIEDMKKLGNSFIPQASRPIINAALNKDLYTGSDTVPDYMIEGTEDPTKRTYEDTSGTARLIANKLGLSPIQVEKAASDIAGSLGRYGVNASDNFLAFMGVIPDNQIGGRSIASDFSRRLFEANAELLDKNKSAGRLYYESVDKSIEKVGLNKNELSAYQTLHPDKTNFLGEEIFNENKRIQKYIKAGTYLQHPKTFEVDKMVDGLQRKRGKPGNPLFDLEGDKLNKVLLKQALPPGASDPELDGLWQKDWYQDYRNATSKYYDSVRSSMRQELKQAKKSNDTKRIKQLKDSLAPQDNPYPQTPNKLQKVMDYYSSLPKGTGDRSAWIKANPGLWDKMINQWQAVDDWENNERVKIGLKKLTDEDKGFSSGGGGYGGYGKSKGGYGRSGSRKGQTAGSDYEYAISLTAGGSVAKPKVSVRKTGGVKSRAKSKAGVAPKVTLRRSLV